jgi:hypothetical protein
VLKRTENLVKNKFNKKNLYNSTNPDAISDGDENGKGPKDENGTVGSKTDILKRTENTGKNSYNSKKEYNRHPTT